MKLGSLSEKEIQEITRILDKAQIPYNVMKDEHTIKANEFSLNNDLRHLSPPQFSTNILAVEFEDSLLENANEETKLQMAKYGVTTQIPEEFFNNELKELKDNIQTNNIINNKNLLGYNLLHQVIFVVALYILYIIFIK